MTIPVQVPDPVVRIAPLYQEIYQLIDANTAGLKIVRGFSGIGQDLTRMVDRMTVVPAAVLIMGTPGEDEYHGGIASSRLDPKTVTFSILCIADDFFQCLQAVDILNSILSGYQPRNCSEISLVPGVARSPVSTTMQPLRFTLISGYALTSDVT